MSGDLSDPIDLYHTDLLRRMLLAAQRLSGESLTIQQDGDIEGQPFTIMVGVGKAAELMRAWAASMGPPDPRSTDGSGG